jgi:hypothetical protein
MLGVEGQVQGGMWDVRDCFRCSSASCDLASTFSRLTTHQYQTPSQVERFHGPRRI